MNDQRLNIQGVITSSVIHNLEVSEKHVIHNFKVSVKHVIHNLKVSEKHVIHNLEVSVKHVTNHYWILGMAKHIRTRVPGLRTVSSIPP